MRKGEKMLCEECKKNQECDRCGKPMDKTTVGISFDIREPSSMKVWCTNDYRNLSMSNTILFKKELHTVLDKILEKIGTEIFCKKVR